MRLTPAIFVIGSQRSGTTLMRLMLNAHSEVAIPEEGGFWMPLLRDYSEKKISYNKLSLILKYIENNSQFQKWHLSIYDVKKLLKKNEEYNLSEVISVFYECYARRHSKVIWGDKTPSFFRMIPVLAELFPQARFIHIVRDGRAVFLSWKKREGYKRSVSVSALEWAYKVRKIEKSLDQIKPGKRIKIRYEDLVSNPDQTLKKVCAFVGVEYEKNMLNFWKNSGKFIDDQHSKLIFKPVSLKSTRRWEKELSESDILKFEMLTSKLLLNFGYKLSNYGAQSIKYKVSLLLELLIGLPLRGFDVIRIAFIQKLGCMFGLGVDTAGKGNFYQNTRIK
jgi:hypothetical protein